MDLAFAWKPQNNSCEWRWNRVSEYRMAGACPFGCCCHNIPQRRRHQVGADVELLQTHPHGKVAPHLVEAHTRSDMCTVDGDGRPHGPETTKSTSCSKSARCSTESSPAARDSPTACSTHSRASLRCWHSQIGRHVERATRLQRVNIQHVCAPYPKHDAMQHKTAEGEE